MSMSFAKDPYFKRTFNTFNFQIFLVSYPKLGVRKLKSDTDLSKFEEGYVEICLPNFG